MSTIQKGATTSGGTSLTGLIQTDHPIIEHNNNCKKWNLTGAEKNDLVEYLKSL